MVDALPLDDLQLHVPLPRPRLTGRNIEQATARQDFRPRPSRLCDWCSHQALCPSFGGTPPPFPTQVTTDPLRDARSRPAPPGADE